MVQQKHDSIIDFIGSKLCDVLTLLWIIIILFLIYYAISKN